MQSASQLVEKPLFGEKAFRFAGGVRGGGRPLVLNRMPANACRRRLRRTAAAFWTAKQTKKRGIVQAVEKVRRAFSTA